MRRKRLAIGGGRAKFRRMRIVLLCGLLLLAAAAGAQARTYTVLITSNGWHTDIAIARADVPAGRLPEAADFPDAVYLHFGWGDANFYKSRDPGVGTAIGAAFPGPAVVHLAGLARRPAETFRGMEEIALTLDAAQFGKLVGHLHDSFARNGARRAASSGAGVYDFSRFYPATGEFHLFNTCNTWTARGLAAAGLPVTAGGVRTADDLMEQLRALPKTE
jgi:uncharacterized protein (TIGR02117 family)